MPRTMEGRPWQVRAKEALLTQRPLANIAGKSETPISRPLRGEVGGGPGDLLAIILVWEGMSADQREDWLARIGRER